MNPGTAVAVVLLAVALLAKHEAGRAVYRLAGVGAGLAGSLGLACLVRHATGWDAELDARLFPRTAAGSRIPPNTAIALVLLGAAIVLLGRPGRVARSLVQIFPALVLGVCGLGLVGYSLGTRPLYGMASHVPMAAVTAVVLGLLAAGALLSRPGEGAVALLRSGGAGGVLARRLVPAAVVVPWVLGWLRLRGEQADLYDAEVGVALMAVSTIALFLALVWVTAASLDRADATRRAAEDDLRRSAETIRDLYDHAPCGYHSVGPDGVFAAVNRTELAWLGYEAGELVGRVRFADLVSPDSRAIYEAAFARLQECGAVSGVELELVRRDGTRFSVLANSAAITGPDGGYLRSRTTLTDLTVRKWAEAEVLRLNTDLERRVAERTAELSAVNASLRQQTAENEMFVYSVSHDLRSPLVNLQGFSRELGKGCQGLSGLFADAAVPPAVREQGEAVLTGRMAKSLEFIQAAVLRLSGIIDALLRLSRAGRVEYRPERVDVAAVVERVRVALASTLAEKAAAVAIGDLPPAWADRAAVEQALANLLGNAVTYLDPDRPGRIEVGCLPAGADGYRAYFVRDNGLGVAAGHQDRIFQPFQRAHLGVGRGEGLGLAIVTRVAERHGGRAWVESAAGQGSTFFISLPAVPG